MQFDWTTFILEMLNFLILLWILQRLIYRPVLAMLDARQQRIQAQIDGAEQLRNEAETLKQHYQSRLSAWQQERDTAQRTLNDELLQLREKALAETKRAQADEDAKQLARNDALFASQQSVLRHQAAETAYSQAAAMLRRLTSPELTHTIVTVFCEDLQHLSDDQQTALRKAAATLITASAVEILSAHPLSKDDHAALSAALNAASGKELSFAVGEDTSLIAGLRVVVGECQLHANLADELAFFRRQNDHE